PPVDEVSSLARRLELDLDGEHLVVVIEAPSEPSVHPSSQHRDAGRPTWQPLADRLERRLTARFPGSLVEIQERSLRAIVPAGEESVGSLLERLRAAEWGGEA